MGRGALLSAQLHQNGELTFPPIAYDADLAFTRDAPRIGYEYWRGLCNGRSLPDRRDIDPLAMTGIIRHFNLLDIVREEEGEIRLSPRLIGTAMEEVFGPIHNRNIEDMLAPAVIARWEGAAHEVLKHKGPLRATGRILHEGKSFLRFEFLLAPLTDGGAEIDVLMVISDFVMTPAAD